MDEAERDIQDLKDGDWKVRLKAVTVLGEIGDQRALLPLVTALEDENLKVSIQAVKVIRKSFTPISMHMTSSWQRAGDGLASLESAFELL